MTNMTVLKGEYPMKKATSLRITAIATIILSTLLIVASAFAGTTYVTSTTPKYKTYSISSSPTYGIKVDGNPGDKLIVELALNDLEKPKADGTPNWKFSNSVTITIGSTGVGFGTISPGSAFHFVPGRSDKARLKFKAPSSNTNLVVVLYPD